MLEFAVKGVSSLINHTLFPYKLYCFSKFHQKYINGHFQNIKSFCRLSQVIHIDVLWLEHPYWPIVSILEFWDYDDFCHSHEDTATNKKIIWSGVYQNYSEVSSNMSAISRMFYGGLGLISGSEIVFLKNRQNYYLHLVPPPWLVKRPKYLALIIISTQLRDVQKNLFSLRKR